MKSKLLNFALIWPVAFVFSFAFGSPQQSAQDQLPTGSLFSAEELAKGFGSHQFTPFGDPKFSLEILVPTGWESHLSDYDPGQLSHDTESPVPMIEFYPNGADDLGVNVQYMRVPGDKPVSAVVDVYAKNANGAIAARQQLDLPGRKGGRRPDEDHRRLPGPGSESCDGFPPGRHRFYRHCLERRRKVRAVQEGFRHRSGLFQSQRKVGRRRTYRTY